MQNLRYVALRGISLQIRKEIRKCNRVSIIIRDFLMNNPEGLISQDTFFSYKFLIFFWLDRERPRIT
jgi:hypothetical protein